MQLYGAWLCKPHRVNFAGGVMLAYKVPLATSQLCGMHSEPSLHSQAFWQNWTEPCVIVGAGEHLLPLPEIF